MHLVNNVQPNKHFQNPNLMLQLKDQGNFAVAILGQDRSRGLKLPTEKKREDQVVEPSTILLKKWSCSLFFV